MAREKSPAYQRYPKDYLSDENVIAMTLEEEGAYNRLMDYCWLEGSIPADLKRLAALCKNVSPKRMQAIWMSIGKCFRPHPERPDRLIHPRLEKERGKQQKHAEQQRENGRKGAAKRWGSHSDPISDPNRVATISPMANDSFAVCSLRNKKDSSFPDVKRKGDPVHVGQIVATILPEGTNG